MRNPLGCLLGIIGAFVGFWLSHLSFQLHIQQLRATDPTRFICGNAAIPGMFLGLICGGIGGIIFGKIVDTWLIWMKQNK